MSNEVAFSGIAVALYLALQSKKRANKKPPRWWIRGIFEDRNKHGHDLVDTLRLEDGMGFRNFVRMSPLDFENLLEMVGPHILKKEIFVNITKYENIVMRITTPALSNREKLLDVDFYNRVAPRWCYSMQDVLVSVDCCYPLFFDSSFQTSSLVHFMMKEWETIDKLVAIVEKVTTFKKYPRYDRHGKELPSSNNTLEELIDTSEAEFFKLSDAAEDKAKYYFLLGKMYNCSPKYRAKALDILCKAVKLDPDAIEAWNELGECYWYHVNVDMARQCFERALEKSENKISFRNLSVVIRKQGLSLPTDEEKHKYFDDAAKYAKRSVQLDPTDGVSWSILGNAYLAVFFGISSEYQHALQAIAAYKQAEKNLEVIDNFEIFYNKGIVLKYIEHYSDALSTLLKTMESEKTWDLPFKTYSMLLQYLDLIMSYIGHKGRLKPKKFYAMLKGLNTLRLGPYTTHKLIHINKLQDGVNKNFVLYGKVLWSIQMDYSFPFTFGLVDVNGDEIVVTVFNLSAAHRFFIIGDSVAIPNPWYDNIYTLHKNKVYQFKKVRVEKPTELIVNDKPLPDSCFAKVKFDTLPMQF